MTTRYNAPEVAQQKDNPIPLEQLHKCDIWAFGLCAWEILANGQLYFQRSWRRNSLYERPHSMSTLLTSPTSSEAPDDIDEDDQHVFGHFDVSHLRALAIDFVNNLKIPGIGFERGFLRPLMDHTLHVDPAQRISDLSRLPIIVSWHKTPGGHSLQSKLATYAMSGDVRYSIFSRESGPYIIWEQQQQLLQDFETVAKGSKSNKREGSIAFQTMLCYVNAFGTSQDLIKAPSFLQMAEDEGHMVARILGHRILNGFNESSTTEVQPYNECLALGFSATRTPEIITSLVAYDGASVTKFTNYADFRKVFYERRPQSWTNNKDGVLGGFVSINGSTSQHSLLEVALHQGDAEFVERLLPLVGQSEAASKLDSLLVSAASRGHDSIVIPLLKSGANISSVLPAPSLLHWLFSLDETTLHEIQSFLKDQSRDSDFKLALDYATTDGIILHPQWPFRVHGTPLAIAIASGSKSVVTFLLSLGADPLAPAIENTDDSTGPNFSPIHLAVKYHHPDILLLLWKAAFDETTVTGTHLHQAATLESFPIACALSLLTNAERFAIHGCMYKQRLRETIKLLSLDLLLQPSPEGRNSVTQAIDLEDVDTVELLLEHAPTLAIMELVQPDSTSLFTYPFHFAVQIASCRDTRESEQIAEFILKLDSAAINRPDSASIKPMHIAAMGSSDRMTKFLLARNASCHELDGRRRTPLHFCRSLVNAKILMLGGVSINHKDDFGFTPAHAAASQGADEVLKALIDAGADLTQAVNEIGTPLHCAVLRKSRTSIEILLAAGVDVEAKNRLGRTPLHLAMDIGRADLVSMLFKKGADPFVEDAKGSSPFSMSLSWENLSIFNMFRPPDNFVVEKLHVNALIFGAAKGESSVFRQYLEKLPNPSRNLSRVHSPKLYVTAINVAAEAFRVDLVKMLLAYGFNVNTPDEKSNTPLLRACQAGRTEVEFFSYHRIHMCETLIQHGADILARNNRGLTSFSIAQAHADYPLMTLFLSQHQVDLSIRLSRILESIKNPEKDDVFCEASRALMGGDIVDPKLVFDAAQKDEWEFVMTCVAGHFINKKNLKHIFPRTEWKKPSVDTLDMLRYHSVKMDRDLVQYLASGARESPSAVRESPHDVGIQNVDLEFLRSRDALNDLLWPEEAKKAFDEAMVKSEKGYFHTLNALTDLENQQVAFSGKLQEYFAQIIYKSKERTISLDDIMWFRSLERDIDSYNQVNFLHRLQTISNKAKAMEELALRPNKAAPWAELRDRTLTLQGRKGMVDETVLKAKEITKLFLPPTHTESGNDKVEDGRDDEVGEMILSPGRRRYIETSANILDGMNRNLLQSGFPWTDTISEAQNVKREISERVRSSGEFHTCDHHLQPQP